VTAPRVGGYLFKEPPIPFFVLSSIVFSPSRSRTGSALKTLTVTPPLLVEIRLPLSRVSVLSTILGIDRRCQILDLQFSRVLAGEVI
jgi:hypothetical protein